MSNFHGLAAFNSNDQYRFSSESHSQGADLRHSYSFGTVSEHLDASQPLTLRTLPTLDQRAATDRPGVAPKTGVQLVPPSQASEAARDGTSGSGGVEASPRLPTAPTHGVSIIVDQSTRSPPTPIAQPPAGAAPPRSVRANSLEKAHIPPPAITPLPSTPIAHKTSTSKPTSPSQHTRTAAEAPVAPNTVVLPRLSSVMAGRSGSADHTAGESGHTLMPPNTDTGARRSPITGDGVSTGTSLAHSTPKKTFAVPPLQQQSLTTIGAPAAVDARPVLNTNSPSESSATPASPASGTGAQKIPGWLAQVNTQLSVQPLPRVAHDHDVSSSPGGADADWLNPRSRPSTAVKAPIAYRASAGTNVTKGSRTGSAPAGTPSVGLARVAPASGGGGGEDNRGPDTAQTVVSPLAPGRGPRRAPSLVISNPTVQRRLSTLSRRTSGAETPHMGLAALRSDSGSSTEASDMTDALSIDREFSRAGTSTSHHAPSLHDGFVSIQHVQNHMTSSSQRGAHGQTGGGGSQLWSGDSRTSGASVANGHRQRPGDQRQGSDVWSSGGPVQLRPPARAQGMVPQTANSMPSRPQAAGSENATDGYPDVGPVRVPREGNYFRRVSRDGSAASGVGVHLGSTGLEQHVAAGRVAPLSLQAQSDEKQEEESVTDLSSKVSGVSLNAETTYVTL